MLDLDPYWREEFTVDGRVGVTWPAHLTQPVGLTQYICKAQDDGQSAEIFAAKLLESSVQLATTDDHAETPTSSSATTIQEISSMSPSQDRCVIYNADSWF